MITHIGFYVKNLAESATIYVPAFKTLGYEVVFQNEFCLALGKNGQPYFEIYTGKPASSPIHMAFECQSKEEVVVFYNSLIQLGATDNGEPGYRKYFPGYYACYVIDPNGHNLEGVFWDEKVN